MGQLILSCYNPFLMDRQVHDTNNQMPYDGEDVISQIYLKNIYDNGRWTVLSLLCGTFVYFYLAWQLNAWQLYVVGAVSILGTLIAAINFLPWLVLSPNARISSLLLSSEIIVVASVVLLEGMGWILAFTLILASGTILMLSMRRPSWQFILRTALVALVLIGSNWLELPFRLPIREIALWQYIFVILVAVFGIALIYNVFWNWRNQSLRTRLITTFGFVAMLTILGVVIFLNRSERVLLQAQMSKSLQQRVEVQATFVSSTLQREVVVLQSLGNEPALQAALANGRSSESAAQILQAIYEANASYQGLWLLDDSNVVVQAGGSTAVFPTQPTWQPTVNSGQPYLGDLKFIDGRYELLIAVPIHASGETAVIGTLLSSYDLRYLLDQMRLLDQNAGGQLQIVTPEGVVALNNLLAPPTPIDLTPTQINRLRAVDALTVENSLNILEVMSLSPVLGRTAVSNLQWNILLTLTETQAFAISNEQENYNILIGMVGAIVSIIISFFFSNAFVRPISRLTEAAIRVTDGDLSATVTVDTNNEIGVLARAFNTMTYQIRENVNELEAKVARRTAALSQANAQLGGSELRYRALATLVADYAGVVITAPDGTVTIDWLSDQARLLLGDVVYDNIALLLNCIHPDDHEELVAMIERVQKGDQSSVDLRFYTKPDQFLWLRVHAYSFADPVEAGKQQIYVAAQDITNERQTQEALSQAERLRSVGVLAGGIAHDFNNLLTGILGQASLVQLRLKQNRPIEKNLESVIKAAEHAADLTQKLLAYAGKGRFELRTFDLNQLLADNRQFLQTLIPPQVRFIVEVPDQPAFIEADTGQLQQVVMNLILNAANACAENGGEVRVQTRPLTITATAQPPTIAETHLAPGEYQMLIVQDTGKGIDEAVLPRIFEPFFTTREDGRGLGLSATLGIIQAHKGGLYVTSTLGAGTTFTIYLPAVGIPLSTASPHAFATTAATSAGKILVIDDEAWVRDVVQDGLGAFGYQVLTADNGREGLILYRVNREQLHLLIVDMQMPLMTGAEFIEYVRRDDPTVKIILSSGYSDADLSPTLTNDNNIWFLQKPYSVQQLARMVGQVLQAVN